MGNKIVVSSGVSYGVVLSESVMSVTKTGRAVNTSIGFGGSACVFNGGGMSQTVVSSMGSLYVSKGGLADYTAVSSYGSACVSKGGLADRTSVFGYGRLYVSQGGLASRTILSGGILMVDKGGLASETTISSGGRLDVWSGATASGVEVKKGGLLWLDSGGTATDVDWTPCVGTLSLNDCAIFFTSRHSGVYYGSGDALLSSAKTMNNKSVLDRSSMYVMHGGSAGDPVVNTGGYMYVLSGGTATGGALGDDKNAGYMVVSGGVVKNATISRGAAYVYNGGIVSGIACGGIAQIQVDSGGTATDINGDGYVRVYSGGAVSGIHLSSGGSLYVEKGARVGGVTVESGAVVELEKGANIKWTGTLLPEPSPNCDDGWNSWLYDKKTITRNRFLPSDYDGVVLNGDVGQILVDEARPKGTLWNNYAGYRDEVDFQKITLKSAANLSFSVSATSSVKFTLWALQHEHSDPDTGKYIYTLKALQTATTKYDKDAGVFTVDTKSTLIEYPNTRKTKGGFAFCEYFISVQSLDAAKGADALYDVENTGVFFDHEDNDNGDDKPDSLPSEYDLGKITSETDALIEYGDGWVGFGDVIDYRKFQVASDATLSLCICATDAVKFTIWERKSNGKLKSLCSVSLKSKKDISENYAFTKPVRLYKGTDYYFSVQSTNAKKGGDAAYGVAVNAEMSEFPSAKNLLSLPDAQDAPAFVPSGSSELAMTDGTGFDRFDTDALAVPVSAPFTQDAFPVGQFASLLA